MNKFTDKFLSELKKTFDADKLKSVILYGSCAVENCSKDFRNINLIVIIKSLTAQDLKLANKCSKDFANKGKILPLFIDYDEWLNSSDVYAIEYADIKDRYKILYGENLVDNLRIENKDLRLQCERETKNLLIRLRQVYLGNAQNKKVIRTLIQDSMKSFLVIFRSILRLCSISVPKTHNEVIDKFCSKMKTEDINIKRELFHKVHEFRGNSRLIKDNDIEEIIQHLIDTTNSILRYIDKYRV